MRGWLALSALLAGVLLATAGASAQQTPPIAAIDPERLPLAHRFEGVRYVTARDAHRIATSMPRTVLIDVRTFEETIFNGVAAAMRRHIPYLVADLDHSFDPAAGRYKLETNPDFVTAVRHLLQETGLGTDAVLLIYCSVGERSARAASLLARSGFQNVYSVADGFEGDPKSPIGPGWKGSGLPWSDRLTAAQAYKSPTF